MTPDKDFKVVIVGAAVAGLTLANMLERFDIDYVVLESHGDVAPAVGASIGLWPNGLRIMDQIGCYETIENLARQPTLTTAIRHETGKRHGYPVLFFDRQWLLKTLFDKLKHPERVLLKKKVVGFDLVDGGVEVTTAEGDSFDGSILIGADGIHSVIRNEMFRLGNKIRPGYFDPTEPDRVQCSYQCSFGISQDVEGYTTGQTNQVQGKDCSQLALSGPQNRVYWFIFKRLPETKYGKHIPKYTKEDEAEFVKRHAHQMITDKVNFGQVYAKKLSSTLTPIHEIVFHKWFFRRVMVVGDAAHKGGNGAIETVAELVNAIVRMRDACPNGLSDLSDSNIYNIFNETQSSRHEREKMLVRLTHEHQALYAYENPLKSKFVNQVMSAYASDEIIFGRMSDPIVDAARVEKLPVPNRPHAIPFTDELPAEPASVAHRQLVRSAFVGGMGLLYWLTTKAFRMPSPLPTTWLGESVIDRPWAGANPAGRLLKALTAIFSHLIAGQSTAARVHTIYFMSQLVAPILQYTIEGNRIGNKGTLLSAPALILTALQMRGAGRIAPLYAAAHAYQSDESTMGRFVAPETAVALVPALVLAYVIPSMLMFTPSAKVKAWQDWMVVAQIGLVAVPLLTCLIAANIKWWRRRGMTAVQRAEAEEESRFDRYRAIDVPGLQSAYSFAFWAQAATHVASFAYAASHPGVSSLRDLFFALPNPMTADWNLPSVAAKVATFFRYDAAITAATYVASNLYSIWRMCSLGYVPTGDAIKAAVGVCVGQAVGPGATWAAVASWKESRMVGLLNN